MARGPGFRPPLIVWASRAAGAMGMVTAVLYLALIIGEDDPSRLPLSIVFFLVMGGAGVAAWFADRLSLRNGRRAMWAAFGVFFVLGVLSVFSVGLLFLIAAVLSILSLSRSSGPRAPASERQG